MDFKYIRFKVTDAVAFITLNRPEKRNAFDDVLVEELKQALTHCAENDLIRALVLKAEGKAFCAGADLAYLQRLQKFTYEENLADSTALSEMFEMLYAHPKITIAQVQGHALAGGCGLATACDFCFAAQEVQFGYTEVKIGFVPAIVMVFLTRKLGEGLAKRLLFTGALISADEAKTIGLITDAVPLDTLEAFVTNFIENMIKTTSAEAQLLTKNMLQDVLDKTIYEGFRKAALVNAQARMTADCKKGITAFLNQEKITWS